MAAQTSGVSDLGQIWDIAGFVIGIQGPVQAGDVYTSIVSELITHATGDSGEPIISLGSVIYDIPPQALQTLPEPASLPLLATVVGIVRLVSSRRRITKALATRPAQL